MEIPFREQPTSAPKKGFNNPNQRPEALPCPFCEEPTDLMHYNRTRVRLGVPIRKYSVICENCGASGTEMPTEVDAINAWNKAKR